MPLSAGDRLGPYEIASAIGAGGMGEVYKARDTRLDRTVAVKVLPEHIARRDDIRQRFEREARAVASLNHPNICVLHDIGSQDGTGYMVMEFMEGETLADRVAKGPIPLEQALKYASQIADALDRAHRAGVIHRDVKPGNIMLTRDGVKVLDFGLAKSSAAPGPADATLTNVMTAEGTVLGTPQYMAPEQFEGREADARSDIWAFGAVLYEMVTGQKAFQGKSYSSLVGAILSADPPPMLVKPFTPPWLERLIRRCIAKDPEDRYQSMRDVVLDLRAPATENVAAPAKAKHWLWVSGALCLAAALLALSAIHFREPPPEMPLRVTSINPPDKAPFREIALSPDGKLLAFTATSEGRRQLWVRPLHALTAQPLAGTEQAADPFWSPDSRWIGFFADRKLKKIEAAGGPVQTLCDARLPRGGTWSAEGVILFCDFGYYGMLRVSAQGGTPAPATNIDRTGRENHRWPVFLPGGRRFLYHVAGADANTTGIYAGALNTTERARLASDNSSPGYAEGPAGEGYLLFVRRGTLMAQRLDAGRGAVEGEAFPVAEKVSMLDTTLARARFSVSRNALLVYESGAGEQVQLTWKDRAGQPLETVGEPANGSMDPKLSPDERQVVFSQFDGPNRDIWVRDLPRGISTRFTFHPALDLSPVWSPDGSRIVFRSDRNGLFALYVKSTNGTGQEQLLLKTGNLKVPTSWSADGRRLLYHEVDVKTGSDLWVLPMEGEGKPAVFLRTDSNEREGAFSPDGKWIAYVSDESGRPQVYVQPYPATGAKWQVSKEGGLWPKWRRDGKEIYWLNEGGTLMSAEVSAGSALQPGIARPLFETHIQDLIRDPYTSSGDGKRFLVSMPLEADSGQPITVVENWLAGVKK
jgi:eukaryotic-like serine/threonine-protein kinase